MDSTFFQHKLNTLRARITNIREFQKQYEKELRLAIGSPAAESRWKELIKGLKSQLEELSEEHELFVQQVASIQQESLKVEASEHLSQLRHDIKRLQNEQNALLGDNSAIAPAIPPITLHEQPLSSQISSQNPPDQGQALGETDVQLKLNALRQRMQSLGTPVDSDPIHTDPIHADPTHADSARASQSETTSLDPHIPELEPDQAASGLLSEFKTQITQKTDNPAILIENVQKWTDNQPFLTDALCKLILEHPSPIPPGQEEPLVTQLVQDEIINDWQNKTASNHLEHVQQSILGKKESPSLLNLYTKILQQGKLLKDDSDPYQHTLLESGLVKAELGSLKIANNIYAAIFNLEWASRNLPPSPNPTITDRPPPRINDSQVAQSTRLWSLGVLLLIPIFAVVYAFLPKATVTPSPSSISKTTTVGPDESNLCTSNAADQESQLNQLVQRKEQEKQRFPQDCQSKLDELFYVTGMGKAKGNNGVESNFNEGVRRLCKVSESNSDYFITARSQLNAWYSSEQQPEFKKFIANYLNVLKSAGQTCPAAKDIPLN